MSNGNRGLNLDDELPQLTEHEQRLVLVLRVMVREEVSKVAVPPHERQWIADSMAAAEQRKKLVSSLTEKTLLGLLWTLLAGLGYGLLELAKAKLGGSSSAHGAAMFGAMVQSHPVLRAATGYLLGGVTLALGAFVALLVLHHAENAWMPVNHHWTLVDQRLEGKDLVIGGTLIKWPRSCAYIRPPRARDAVTGEQVQVVSLAIDNGANTWAADEDPQVWGPWRVIGGVGRQLEFYQIHQCHKLWLTTSRLGTVDARQVPAVQLVK